ncbi:hypothetical protein CV102_10590 [Natronococcus pandeyae]|uniref:DUF1616 domain-containing protein n=1 Tax=Natronococcus pandeyae TaxID=2055836 RepID=A0A8J8Q5G9_9EURY|nr:DUF1616 domain-containing protein [Natronococcus pandeyae]TYL38943.1 hypothetical protein CV102_10590 [Natronococcus pandeyae]
MGSHEPSESIRGLPADLAGAVLITGLVNVAVFAPVIRETPLRVLFGLAFVLFVPGYVVVAALFPEREGSGVDGVDRLSLSVVASVIVVPVVGLVMNVTPWGIRLGPTLAAVSLVTLALIVVAARRRRAVPPAERFRVPYRERIRQGTTAVRPNGIGDLALTLSLAVAVVLAVGAVGFAIADHHAGYGPDLGEDDGFSAISLVDSDGDLVTNESEIAELEPGTAESVFVGIDNHEDEPRSYTVVALEQELDDEGTVADERELERFDLAVDDGETETYEHELEPTTEEDVQFVWLLYPEEVPEEPSTDSAEAHVSLTVSDEETDE